MTGRYSKRLYRVFSFFGVLACLAMTLAACSVGGGSSTAQGPITIGISLSTTGDFSADGKAFQQGYQLWADDINAKGGLLGRQVKLVILNDASSPQQVTTNYQTLITQNKVDVLFGPFSTLLTKPA
ncbi:MAG TPA: ABC transporter substrate-binding protein, partial [Ktedonobacterales bacterium]